MKSDRASGRGEACSFGPFHLHRGQRMLTSRGKSITIGGRTLDLLIALTDEAGKVLSQRNLIDQVWPDVLVEDANLRVHIALLRKILHDGSDGARYIVTIPGRGYSFVAPIRQFQAYDPPDAPVSSGPPSSSSLPASSTRLIGRDASTAAISTALLKSRLVTIVGPGGIGKTSVAIATAKSLHSHFDGGIYYIDLGCLNQSAEVPSAVAAALDLPPAGPDDELRIEALRDGAGMLIVLDCCEHVIDVAAKIASQLHLSCPGIYLLITSREALRIQGEYVHPLPPLEFPPKNACSFDDAIRFPAIQLFMERAALGGHNRDLGHDDARIVIDICRRLEGNALAIQLAASRVGSLGIAGVAGMLDHNAELHLRGQRDAVARHQSLQAMLNWSYCLLSAEEQVTFQTLSTFAGDFELADAYGISDADTHRSLGSTVASLCEKSLVGVSSSEGATCYRLADTTRAFAAAKLADSGQAPTIARRHALYFTARLAELLSDEESPRQHPLEGRHIFDLRKAVAWCFSDAGDRSVGIHLILNAVPFFKYGALLGDCRRWCRLALNALDESDRGTRRELKLLAALATSAMYTEGGGPDVSCSFERSLMLSDTLHEQRHQLHLLINQSTLLIRQEDFRGALANSEQCLDIARALGGPRDIADAQWTLGSALHLVGEQSAALRHCQLGFDLIGGVQEALRSISARHTTRGLVVLARALWLCGFTSQSHKLVYEIVQAAEREDHFLPYCVALLYTIQILIWSGDLDEAERLISAVDARAEAHDAAPFQQFSRSLLGELLLARGEWAAACRHLRETISMIAVNRHEAVRMPAYRAFAEALIRIGSCDEALAVVDEALTHSSKLGETMWLPELLRLRGEVLAALPHPDVQQAEECLLEAIKRAENQSAIYFQLKATSSLAHLWPQQKSIEGRQLMLDEVCRRFPESGNNQELAAARRLLTSPT